LPETKYLIDFWLYLSRPSFGAPFSPVTNETSKPAVPPTPAFVLPTPLKLPAMAATPARKTLFSPLKNAMGSLLIKTPSYFASIPTPAKQSVARPATPNNDEDKENTPVRPASKDGSEDKTPLVQKTCPPKQAGRRLWVLEESETPLQDRLKLKRRMSQGF
jgi:hypothetical protein